MAYSVIPAVNWTYGRYPEPEILDSIPSGVGASTDTGAGLRGFFGRYRGALRGFHPLRDLATTGRIGDPDLLGWDTKNGINVLGGKLGNAMTGVNALYQGANAINNLDKVSKTKNDTTDVKNSVLASAASNPLASQYLTADQLQLLNKLKRGNVSTDAGFLDNMGDIGMGALKSGAIGFATGGVPGAIVGAIGGGTNAGLQAQNKKQAEKTSELEGLLQALNDAEMQYKSMRRPNFTGLGIQQRYQDMYR